MVELEYGSKAAMTVIPLPGRPKTRRVNALFDALAGIEYGVHNPSLQNNVRAILERVFFVNINGNFVKPPRPDRRALKQLKIFSRRFSWYVTTLTPWTHDRFVASYTGQKKVVYAKAAESLIAKPICFKDAYISAFVKAEKTNLTAKADPAPRIIQPRRPRYNVELGCYLKPIESPIYKIIGKIFGSTTVAKGMNSEEQGALLHQKWQRFNAPVAVGLDASRFDQHCSRDILSWEHTIYHKFYPNCPELKWLLSLQLKNKGWVNCEDGTIKYHTDGCRMSGDMNTGLGNCLIMCALVWTYFGKFKDYELLNNGDDCVVILEKSELARLDNIPKWFLSMGYTMKVEPPVYDIYEIEFCQTHPVFDGVKWRMMRDPRVALSKDLISIKNLSGNKAWETQCQAISDCGKALAGDCPIFCEFYRCLNFGRIVERSDPSSGLEWLSRGLTNQFSEPNDHLRFSFWRAFKITPDQQVAIENTYRGMNLQYMPGPVVKHRNLEIQHILN